MLESAFPPRWIEHAIHLIADEPSAALAFAIVLALGTSSSSNARSHALYHLFVKADQTVFRRQIDPMQRVDPSPLLEGIPAIHLDNGTSMSPDARLALEGAGLDVIVCFGSPEPTRRLIGLARYGVWYYPSLHSDGRSERPVGFEATVAGRDVVTTSLNELSPAGTAGRTLYAAVSAVNRYSPHYTDHRLRWKMATFPARALAGLTRSGAVFEFPLREVELSSRGETAALPGNVRMLGIAARLGWRLIARAVRSTIYRSEWSVAFRSDPHFSAATFTRSSGPGAYAFIESPPDRFWADPFPVRDGDRLWLFVEEFPRAADRAHLSVMPLRQDGAVGPSTAVLVCPYHLSYPFVFRWRDDWYMVPETLENRTVELYRSTRFPYEWTHVQTLLVHVPAVDATLFEHDGRWWMFTTIAPFGGSENDELHIFMAETPLGPWRPHPRNPQASDVRGSRSAGRIFSLDGAWYRPAQDCSRRYGYAMTIQRIVTLTEEHFEEEVAGRIEPSWARGLLGTHTFNHLDGVTLVDGDCWRPRFRVPFRRQA